MDDFETKPITPQEGILPPSVIDEQAKQKLGKYASGATIETNSFWSANKFYIAIAILGLVLIGLTLWWLMSGKGNGGSAEADVAVTVQAPEQTPGGTDFVYRITVQNKDDVTLSNNELELIYPEGVTYIDSQPSANTVSGRTFSLPELKPGDPAVIVSVRVRMQGNIGDIKTLQAKFHYHLGGGQGLAFSKTQEHVLRIIASDVTIEIKGPDNANNAQLVTYEVTYQNRSDKPLDNARLTVQYPPGFSFGRAEPAPNLSNNSWSIARLAPGETGKISVSGNFLSAVAGESKQWQASFLMTDNQGNFYTQATGNFSTTIGTLPLLVTQRLESDGQGIVNPGDTLSFIITYQNNKPVAARGVNIIASIDSQVLDTASIRAEGAQISNNTITWNAASQKDLEVLNPNESGEVRYTVRIKNPPVRDGSTRLEVKTNVKIKSDEFTEYLPGNNVTAKLATKTTFGQTVSFAGGSVPPRAGNQTLLRVTWTVRNTSNEVIDAEVVGYTPLGSNSFIADSVPPGEVKNITFDGSTGKIVWKVNNVAAYAGSLQSARSVSFTLKALPARSQVGEYITAVKDVVFSGKDSFTGQTIQIEAGSIGSGDAAGSSGDGSVQE